MKKGQKHTETSRQKISNALKGKPKSKEHLKKLSFILKGKKRSDETRRKLSVSHKGKQLSPTHRKKISDAIKGKNNPLFGKHHSIETRKKHTEILLGGFWYGNVRYGKRKKYCELWNRDLWERIDAYQNYKSILSGKTKEDNNNRALSRHHVYWQEKACCEWDEDSQGYYATINIGTAKRPNMYKYYVGDDPNKFVLLTSKEHGMVSKDKLKWIRIFEDLIKKQGGKCYYTQEEFTLLNSVKQR